MLIFEERGKPKNLEKNPQSKWGGSLRDDPNNSCEGDKVENQQQTQPTYMMLDLGIKRGTHWWEASALTTAPPQLSMFIV